MLPFRPSRLILGRCREAAVARGLSLADTKALLYDMIRDGRLRADEVDRNGPPLYFADPRINNRFIQTEIECRWGWSWLRENPDIDIDASTILAPDLTPEPQPTLSMTEITFRQRLPSPPAPPPSGELPKHPALRPKLPVERGAWRAL